MSLVKLIINISRPRSLNDSDHQKDMIREQMDKKVPIPGTIRVDKIKNLSILMNSLNRPIV